MKPWTFDDFCRALCNSLPSDKDWDERCRLFESVDEGWRWLLIKHYGLLPTDAGARKRMLASMSLDRAPVVELDDLMARFLGTVEGLYNYSDGKIEMSLEPMLEALERHCEDLRQRRKPRAITDPKIKDEFLQKLIRQAFPPLTKEQDREWHRAWRRATPMEQDRMWSERSLLGAFFINGRAHSRRNGHAHSKRGRPLNPQTEFRDKRIAAFTKFKQWEGCVPKAAVAYAVALYGMKKSTVHAAVQQWGPQMEHLNFDPATAKKYRERLEDHENSLTHRRR